MTVAASRARELFCYDPATGILTRRARTGRRWLAGMEVGHIGTSGYRCVEIDGREYKVHRVIWLIVTGAWPSHEIDHINRVRLDNRWANLREATNEQNRFNRSRARNNVSGSIGVHQHKPSGKWQATIGIRGAQLSIGYFATKEEAACARNEAARAYHGQFFAAAR